ncbi:MAG: hypothetical protein HY887_01200 [Deltaproteobacteria bacterium]|nr:hypothetical protein [Deltaproteobacteria bacterium]
MRRKISVMTIYKISMIARMQKAVLIMSMLLLSLAGCAGPGRVRIVQPGDGADIRFLCRLQTGEVVAATDKAVGQQTALPKSAVFLLRAQDGPVSVKAAAFLPEPSGEKEKPFEMEIIDRLAGAVVGMKEGESRTVELTAEELPERGQDDYFLRVARVRERSKEMRMTTGDYRYRTGKPPETGQPFVLDPAVQGRVETVTQEEVVILFSARPGDVVQTPFGPGRIRESEKAYEIEIDARKGDLVRTGPLVGRVAEVDEQFITIDYRHPFGGEKLICDTAVEKVAKIKPMKSGAGE